LSALAALSVFGRLDLFIFRMGSGTSGGQSLFWFKKKLCPPEVPKQALSTGSATIENIFSFFNKDPNTKSGIQIRDWTVSPLFLKKGKRLFRIRNPTQSVDTSRPPVTDNQTELSSSGFKFKEVFPPTLEGPIRVSGFRT
jgi:hypothetical protein